MHLSEKSSELEPNRKKQKLSSSDSQPLNPSAAEATAAPTGCANADASSAAPEELDEKKDEDSSEGDELAFSGDFSSWVDWKNPEALR